MKLAARDAAHQSHAAAHTGAVVDATQCKLHDPLKDLKNWFLTLQKDALKAADAATAGFSLMLEPKLPTQLETHCNTNGVFIIFLSYRFSNSYSYVNYCLLYY